jgi:hypothetical protein
MACPNCGKPGRRKRIRTRRVRSLCYQKIAWLQVDYGEYIAKCGCCKSFHSHPPNVDLKAKYDHQVRQAVIDRILQDKLNLSTVQASMQRDFLLKLSSGYIYSALEHAIRHFDGNAFRQQVLTEFRGALCIDEIHLGRRVLLLASDPISDNPVACALVSKNDAAHMVRFMRNLKNRGFSPHTVISDRSPLYPSSIQSVWPEAKYQLCVFHVIAEINKLVLDAARQIRRELKPKQIKKGRGRPSRKQQAKARRLKKQRAQADKLFRHRHVLVRKRSKMTKQHKQVLEELISLSPVLKTLRSFTDDMHALFTVRRSKHQAWRIWRRMRRNAKYLAVPVLAKARDVLNKPNMQKLLVYLDEPLIHRTKTRTNNHVERCNRKLRYLEKVRYKWRRSRTIIRHVLLQFKNWQETKQIKANSII